MPIRQMESSEQHLVIKSPMNPMPTKNKGRRRGRGGRKLGQCDQFSSRSTIEHQIQDGGLVGDIETGFPSSSNSLRFPARPGFGQAGTRCIVKANHFLTELPDKDLHHYDVKITPEVTLKNVNRSIIQELVKLYKDSDLGMRLPAYDGMKSLYTAGELPFSYREFDVKIVDKDDGDGHQRGTCLLSSEGMLLMITVFGLISLGLRRGSSHMEARAVTGVFPGTGTT